MHVPDIHGHRPPIPTRIFRPNLIQILQAPGCHLYQPSISDTRCGVALFDEGVGIMIRARVHFWVAYHPEPDSGNFRAWPAIGFVPDKPERTGRSANHSA